MLRVLRGSATVSGIREDVTFAWFPLLALFVTAGLVAFLPASQVHANEGAKDPLEQLGRPQLKVALMLSPTEQVPISAQLDLFDQFAEKQLQERVVAARMRHVEGSQVAYLELFTNPFRERGAAGPEKAQLVRKAASLLSTWYDGLQALERAAEQLRDPEPGGLQPVLVRGLFDGDAVAEQLAQRNDGQPDENADAEENHDDTDDAEDDAEDEGDGEN